MTGPVKASWGDVARAVDIVDIRATDTVARLIRRGPMPQHGETIEASFKVFVGFVREADGGFLCVLTVDVRPRRKAGEREFARFVYRCHGRYHAKQAFPDDILQQFAQTNGMVHLWPYARSWIQTASAGLGLNPIVLPAFRVMPPNPKPAKSE